MVDTVHKRLKAALEQLSECEEEKGRAESEVESLRQQLDSLQQATTTRIRVLESELEKAAGRAAAMKEGLHELQKERDGVLRQEREAREAAARCRQEADSAVAEARRLENRIADQDRDVEVLRERLGQAEKLGAVAEERARQFDAMVTEQRTRIKALTDFERRAITAEARLKVPSSRGKKGNGGDVSRSVQPGPNL